MAQYRPKQRASSGTAPVRLLDRREGPKPLLVATQATPVSSRKKSPKPRHNSKLYTPKSARDDSRRPSPSPVLTTLHPPLEDAQVLLQSLNTWEKQLKICSEDQDAAEAVRTALRRACVELIKAYPKTAKKLHVSERLWKSWYREINGQPSLAACAAFYSSLVDRLEAALRRPNLQPDHRDGLNHSLQLSLVASGDVARYEQNQREKGELRDWTAARQFYHRALEVAPSNGKVYNQLGLLAVLEGKLMDGAYLYARSLACESPFATSDNLLHVLQRGKTAEKQLQTQQQSSGTPSCEAMETFSARILSCMYMILVSRDPKSKWGEAMERMQAALVQLLDVCDQQDETMPIDGPLLEELSSTITRAVCLAIVLTHNSQHNIGDVSDRGTFDEAFEKTGGKALTQKSLAVGGVIITSLLSKLTAVLSTSAESTRTKYFANALLPALIVYLDWLHVHQALMSKVNPFAATIEGSCVELFRTLSAKGFVERGLCCIRSRQRDGDLSGAVLPEDREMNGFLPYMKALETRFPEELTPKNKLSQQLTEEERLVLRATRFMALSERYAFSGASPTPAPSVPVASVSKPRSSDGPSTRTRNTTPRASRKASMAVTVDPFAVDPVLSGRLCILCSNTSTFVGGVCEFCGYEDEDLDVDTASDEEAFASQPSWIQDYDVAYNNNDSSPDQNSTPLCSPSQHRRSSATSSSSSPQSGSPISPPDTLETDFKTIMSIGAEHSDFQDSLTASEDQQRLIVIDAPNVAMRHGKGKLFSCAGIELAVKYFQVLGHRVVAFIPDYMLQSDEERALRQEQGEVLTAAKIPDDVALLEHLVHKGVLIPTPPQDYDDSYSIQYAGLHDGYVVTNDLFRDHIVNMVGPRERKVAMRAWLRAHQISYSWVRNEFLPNPNFRFPDAAGGAL
ncbi:hypothetical protein PRIC1_014486 [Phytophthora ramorum]|nr:putative ribonuclease ZC3H12C [Phytophthora ramorum]